MLNLVIFGPPGSGKGTQAVKIAEKFNLFHLSTGDIFRANIKGGTELGNLAQTFMDKGDLVPDEVTIKMLQAEVEKHPEVKGFIFDGFPRTIPQADSLDKFLATRKTNISNMLSLEVEDEELLKRIILRGKNSGRADDQNEEIVRNRIKEYNTKTAPLKNYYLQQGKCKIILGLGGIEEIFGKLCAAIETVV